MPGSQDHRPTIGVLPAWSPVVENSHDQYLSTVVGGIRRAASRERCHLLPETYAKGGRAVSTAIFQAMLAVSDLKRPLTFSIGIAELGKGSASSPEALVASVDHALYEAKRGGRNRSSVFGEHKSKIEGQMS